MTISQKSKKRLKRESKKFPSILVESLRMILTVVRAIQLMEAVALSQGMTKMTTPLTTKGLAITKLGAPQATIRPAITKLGTPPTTNGQAMIKIGTPLATINGQAMTKLGAPPATIRLAMTKITPPPTHIGQATFLMAGYGTVMASIPQTTFTAIPLIITTALMVVAISQAMTKIIPPPIPIGQATSLKAGYGTVMASTPRTTHTVIRAIIAIT